jgi:hypothetical protein
MLVCQLFLSLPLSLSSLLGTTTFPNPSRLQLSNFLAKAREEGIRMEVIFYLLEEQLSNQDWKRKLRGMPVCEKR